MTSALEGEGDTQKSRQNKAGLRDYLCLTGERGSNEFDEFVDVIYESPLKLPSDHHSNAIFPEVLYLSPSRGQRAS